jgi:hypothetical protein
MLSKSISFFLLEHTGGIFFYDEKDPSIVQSLSPPPNESMPRTDRKSSDTQLLSYSFYRPCPPCFTVEGLKGVITIPERYVNYKINILNFKCSLNLFIN